MNKIPPLLSLFIAVAFLSSCVTARSGPVTTAVGLRPLQTALGPGWQCNPTPTGFEAPGTVFTLDRSGVRYDEIDLSSSFKTQEKDRLFGSSIENTGFSLGASLSLLKGLIQNFQVDATVDLKTTRMVSLIINGGKEERSYNVDYEIAKKWVAEHRDIYDGGRRAFVVRNAFLINKIKYNFDASSVNALGGDVKFKELATLTGKSSPPVTDPGAKYDLDLTLPEYRRICILPEELVVPAGAAGATEVLIKGVTSDLKIDESKEAVRPNG